MSKEKEEAMPTLELVDIEKMYSDDEGVRTSRSADANSGIVRKRRALQAIFITVVCAVLATSGVAWYMTVSADGDAFPPLYSMGLLMGVTSYTLMVLMTVMMVRVPLVERAFGHDEMLRVHMRTGIVAFTLLVAHLVLIGAGHLSGSIPEDTSGSVPQDAGEGPAVIATVVLIVVAITSSKKIRLSSRYESWHLAHLGTYLAIALALPHILFQGPGWVRVYWACLGISSLLLAFVFRFLVPAVNSRRYALHVTQVIPHGDDAATIVMSGQNLGRWQAGMFGYWRFYDGSGRAHSHPYSISSEPTDSSLAITVKAVGDGSARAIAVPVGTKVSVDGPYGVMTLENTEANLPLLFIGSGSGMGPLKSLIESSDAAGRAPVVIQRSSGQGEALLSSEIESALARHNGTYIPLSGHRRSVNSWAPTSVGDNLNDAQLLQVLVPDIANREIFICGPTKWAESVKSAARAAGVPHKHLHTEAFTS